MNFFVLTDCPTTWWQGITALINTFDGVVEKLDMLTKSKLSYQLILKFAESPDLFIYLLAE